MSLAMLGNGASYEFRWRRWALLRDVVVTHVAPPDGPERFAQFVSIGRALGVPSIKVDAEVLAGELREISDALAERSIDDLVLGPITARVLYPNTQLETPRPLTRIELNQITPVADARNLAEYFASMIDTMLNVCAHPYEGGFVEIHDG